MAVDIARLYQGFISIGPNLPGGHEAYFADVTRPTFVAQSCLYNTQTIVLDAVVVSLPPLNRTSSTMLMTTVLQIYRTYVVWKSILVCILPIIGWLGLVGTRLDACLELLLSLTNDFQQHPSA